jgi:phytoene synthase
MPDAFDHCEQAVRDGDKDRFFATLFAPEKYRRPLFALYAFNLDIARIRELAREPMPGEIRLQWWRDMLSGTGHGAVEANPVAAALRDTVVRYRLPPQALADLIEARSFDLYDDPMPSMAVLDAYARHTSSVLIELAARILNDGKDPRIGSLAEHLGIAYAYAGLLQAVPNHAARGQLYLPAEVLQRHGADPHDLLSGRATPELRASLAELGLSARRHLEEGRALLDSAPEAIVPALLPLALVRPVLNRMDRASYDPLRPKPLAQWRRQWILWRAARRGLRNAL